MTVARETALMSRSPDGLAELYVDWDYDDVNNVGVKLHGVRVVNNTPDLVWGLWVYGIEKGSQRTELYKAEFQPGTDTGNYLFPSSINIRSGGFNFNFAPLRYAP